MSCSEKLKLELARNALMQCFSADSIYSSNWSSAGRDQFSYFWFWNISSSFKVVKTSSFNIFQMKKTLQFSVLKVFLSKYNLIMPTIPKLSWKYCRSPKIEFLFFSPSFLFLFPFFNLFIFGKPSTFSRVLLFIRLWEWKKICPGCLPIHLVQSIKTRSSVRHTSVQIH